MWTPIGMSSRDAAMPLAVVAGAAGGAGVEAGSIIGSLEISPFLKANTAPFGTPLREQLVVMTRGDGATCTSSTTNLCPRPCGTLLA